MSPRVQLLSAAALLVGSVAIVLVVVLTGGGPSPSHTTLTVPVPGPDQKVTVDRDNQLDADEQREARQLHQAAQGMTRWDVGKIRGALEGLDLHEDMRDETPNGITRQDVQEGLQEADPLTLDKPQRPAGAQAYSCPARPVVNQSALSSRRYGVALHFTVSNPGSLDAIRGLFNRPSFGASSNYGFELFNLRCQEWVPVGRKAWAQGPFNSPYVSIEIISNDRSRASWLDAPAIKYGVLAGLVRDLLKRAGAPARLVDPQGCTPLAGIVDHDRLECGNNHWDVGKNFPWDVFVRQVRQGVAGRAANVLTRVERGVVAKRCYHRKQLIAGKNRATNLKWARHYIRRIGKLRANLRRLGLTATRNRKLRHRVLGGYATGKACR